MDSIVTDSGTGLPSGRTTFPETNTGRSISGIGFSMRGLGLIGMGFVGLVPPVFPDPGRLCATAATGYKREEQTRTTIGVFMGRLPAGFDAIIRPLGEEGLEKVCKNPHPCD